MRTKPQHGLDYGRIYDIPDEDLIREREIEKVQEEEAKRDMTWEEFLQQYETHIQGKVDPTTRTANRPGDDGAADDVAHRMDQDDAKSKFTSIDSQGGKSRGTTRDFNSSK
jgi:hypothetical protein